VTPTLTHKPTRKGRAHRTHVPRVRGLFLFMAIAFLAVGCTQPALEPPAPEPAQEETAAAVSAEPLDDPDAPYEPRLSVVTPDELSSRIQDARGVPMIVNVWAPWCKPCVDEMPELEAFYTKWDAGQGQAKFISVSVMSNVDLRLRPFLEDNRIPFEVLHADAETPDAVVNALPWETAWDGALPATFALDANGNLLSEWFEEVTTEMLEEALGLS
jgi:thiol-disulfide isomerase/thioredoxin